MRDRVADFLDQWRRERPDLDPAPMGVVGRISRVDELLGRGLQSYFAEYGLQRGEFDVLATLRRSGAPYTLTPGALADTAMLSAAAVTNRLNRMESKGLITRSVDPANRRAVLVALTEDGLRLVDEVVAGHLENERSLLAPLSADEQRRLATLLAKLLAGHGDTSRADA